MASFVARGRNSTWKSCQKSRSLFSNYHYQRDQRAAAFAHVGTREGENVEYNPRARVCFFDDSVSVVDSFFNNKNQNQKKKKQGLNVRLWGLCLEEDREKEGEEGWRDAQQGSAPLSITLREQSKLPQWSSIT